MTAVPQVSKDAGAIKAIKRRFVRIPSANGYPRFRDMVSTIEQSDPAILVDYYRKQGGDGSRDTIYLLESLSWMYGESFLPNGPPVLDGDLLNLWQPSAIQPSGDRVLENQVAPFIQFLVRLFPNDFERRYFTWWLAHVVKRPEMRITATPVLRSEHGVGKGFLAETVLARLLGKSSVAVCALKDVVGHFNDVIEGKTLLLIDEVYKSKKTTTDALKSFLGNSTVLLHRKHKPAIAIDNYINFIITSNDRVPLAVEKGDRRFWVPAFIGHQISMSETGGFINNTLKPWLVDAGGFQLVRDYLEQVDMAAYRSTDPSPNTTSKQELIGKSEINTFKDRISELVAEHKVLTVALVKAALIESNGISLTDVALGKALSAAGCQQRRSNQVRYYITEAGFRCGLTPGSPPAELEKYLSRSEA